ncbi:MAG: hypothetical protein H0U70_01745 [Tatlockia sp.]|nr:hypothetical protein [Tatlockia sp.]
MQKFRSFESPSKILFRRLGKIAELLVRSYYHLNAFDDPLKIFGKESSWSLVLGGLNPLLAMTKDLVDTFKPYKSNFYIWRDLLQPLRGLSNVIKGLLNLALAPLLLAVDTLRTIYFSIKDRSLANFPQNMLKTFARALGGVVDGLANITRGLIQIGTTPLNWFLRMPIRGTITAKKGMPILKQQLSDKAEKLEQLVNKEHKHVNDSLEIDLQMQYFKGKIDKAFYRCQEVGINRLSLNYSFTFVPKFTTTRPGIQFPGNDSTENRKYALNFLGLFKTNPTNDSLTVIQNSFNNTLENDSSSLKV